MSAFCLLYGLFHPTEQVIVARLAYFVNILYCIWFASL